LQASGAISQSKPPAPLRIARITLPPQLPGHIAQAAPCLIADGTGGQQGRDHEGQQNDAFVHKAAKAFSAIIIVSHPFYVQRESAPRPTPALPVRKTRALFAGVTPNPQFKEIKLSIGEPQHRDAAFIMDALASGLKGLANYPTTQGIPALRQAIAAWMPSSLRAGD
jgi:hypothetical protein